MIGQADNNTDSCSITDIRVQENMQRITRKKYDKIKRSTQKGDLYNWTNTSSSYGGK